MRVLVACEESQRVCVEFRKRGHEAYSCDLMDCSGEHPEWHYKQDVLELLDNKWDLLIAHPPCTYLSVVGNRALKENPGRYKLREGAFEFFMKFMQAPIDKICVENPVGYVNTHYRKPDQIIHPYYFGEPFQKRTCLWLKNLPKLDYSKTIIAKPEPVYICHGEKSKGKKINWCEAYTGKDRAIGRSKTFISIAKAMAKQWG